MLRYIYICAFAALVIVSLGCKSRNFGVEKNIIILRHDLTERVKEFCLVNNRPPKAEEVFFTDTPLPNYFWYISGYTNDIHDEYRVIIIDKEDNELMVIYNGKGDQTKR